MNLERHRNRIQDKRGLYGIGGPGGPFPEASAAHEDVQRLIAVGADGLLC
jgi:hypothetical protein